MPEIIDSEVFSRYFDIAEIKQNCHECIEEELTEKERIASDILHWARNLKMKKEEYVRYDFYPGPKGIRDKRGCWWPTPMESCDCPNGMYLDLRSKEQVKSKEIRNYWRDPWSIWKHCKSLQHCQYLIKYKKNYIYTVLYPMDKLISIVLRESYPLLINEAESSITYKFVQDALSGKSPFIGKYSKGVK